MNLVRMVKGKANIQYNSGDGEHLSKRTSGSELDFSMYKIGGGRAGDPVRRCFQSLKREMR